MQICSLVWSLYIWQVKTILPVGSVDGDNVDGTDTLVEADWGVDADNVASRFGAGVDAPESNLQAKARNTRPLIKRIRLFIIIHLDFVVLQSISMRNELNISVPDIPWESEWSISSIIIQAKE